MNKKLTTIFVSKYALSDGIKQGQAEIDDERPSMACGPGIFKYYHGDEWHITWEAAVVKAESMRIKKIASLKKQIAKLEKLSFGERQP